MWSNRQAQPAACCGVSLSQPATVVASPFHIARDWRDQGWLRQIKVFRLRRQRKGWQVAPWWRYPPGRWPAPPREIIAWAQRQAISGKQHPCHILLPPHLAISFLLSSAPAHMALYCMELSDGLGDHDAFPVHPHLVDFHAVLQAQEPFHPHLGPGDLRIARMLLEGLGQTEVATQLGLSESTVRSRITVLCRRYGAPNRRALLACLFKTMGPGQQDRRRSPPSTPAHLE